MPKASLANSISVSGWHSLIAPVAVGKTKVPDEL